MLPDPVRTILSLIAPAGLLIAAELPRMEPTPSKEPAARSQRLVNEVSSYGMINYRTARRDSRIERLYHEIAAFAARLDTRVLGGELHRPARSYEVTTDERGYPQAQASEREPLGEEQALLALLERLAVLRQQIPYPNHFEQWQFDESWANLRRSADGLRLGLSESAYLDLEAIHAAWITHYHQQLARAQAEYALDLVEQGQSPSAALSQAKEAVQDIPYPPMSLDGSYAPVVIPPVVPQAKEAPQPEPEPEPVTKPELEPAEPMDETPAEPAAAPAEPTEAPEQQPADAPTPQPEAPAAPDAGSIADADAIFAAGEAIYVQAVETGDFDRRDELYNTAEFVLRAAVDLYSQALEAAPEDADLSEKLRQASLLRSGSIKQARNDAQSNPAARQRAQEVIAAALAGDPLPAIEPEPTRPEPEPEPMIEEPAPEPEPVVEDVEPEPEPMIEEPAPEPEPEPMVEDTEPEPEPEPAPAEEEPVDEAEVDEAVDALDDLDWPDL